MIQQVSFLIVALSVLMACSITVDADIIYFKNGRHLEGVVKRENAENIVVNVGAGEISFSRDEIDRIDRASTQENEILVAEANENSGAPEYAKEVTTLLSTVRMKRSLVSRYTMQKIGVERVYKKKEKAVGEVYRKYKKATAQWSSVVKMKRSSTSKDRQYIAKQRDAVIALEGEMKNAEFELKSLEREIFAINQKKAEALHELTEEMRLFVAAYETYIKKHPEDRDSNYAKHMKKVIDEFNSDWVLNHVPLQRMGNNYVANVRINNKVMVPLIVDTGASAVYLSRSVAQELGIKEDDYVHKVSSTLADGRSVEGDLVVLKSVEVGGMKVNEVRSVILDTTPHEDVSGLLGMTYLGHFKTRIDAQASTLILEQYER